MEIEVFYNELYNELKSKIHFLEDKPEETVDSTLKALWMTASGISVSAEKAINMKLPKLKEKQVTKLLDLIDQRLNNIPLAHITKRQNFLGIELITDQRALIPRKETEILGKKALELSAALANEKNEINILDICCGSGNLGIGVAKLNPKCRVYSSDISNEAVKLTQENINFLNLNDRIEAFPGDMYGPFKSDKFYNNIDLIICNPPYISSAKVVKMDLEIALNEPSLAFDGGMLGIKIIQNLISEAPLFLTKKGWLVFEIGVGQGDFVIKLIEKTKKFQQIGSVPDDSGNIRVVFAQKYPDKL